MDEAGLPLPGAHYVIDRKGKKYEKGWLDENGCAKVKIIGEISEYIISFPSLIET
jgi:hypothetical protein